MWDACNCRTRAKTARATGESRLKSATVVVSGLEDGTLDAMRAAQKRMQESRREYAFGAADAREISAEDQADIRANLIPRVQDVYWRTYRFLEQNRALHNRCAKRVLWRR